MTNTTPAKQPKAHDRFATINYMVDGGFAAFRMTSSERLIYLALWRHADKRGHCHVSYSRLESGSGLTDRCCKSSIKSLIAKDVVQIVSKGNIGGKPNHYRIYGKPKKRKCHPPPSDVASLGGGDATSLG